MKARKKIKYAKKTDSKGVTSRFMKAMMEIIATHRRTGGKARNMKRFAISINTTYSNFSSYDDTKNGRNVTLEMCSRICSIHGVNGHWLLTGEGDRFFQKDMSKPKVTIESLAANLEKRLNAIEKGVAKGKK